MNRCACTGSFIERFSGAGTNLTSPARTVVCALSNYTLSLTAMMIAVAVELFVSARLTEDVNRPLSPNVPLASVVQRFIVLMPEGTIGDDGNPWWTGNDDFAHISEAEAKFAAQMSTGSWHHRTRRMDLGTIDLDPVDDGSDGRLPPPSLLYLLL